MRLYNTLARKIEDFKPLHEKNVTVYSCGPTVYDHIHIGNLAAFIAADTLHRTLSASGYEIKHVMNFTDVDDKTIRRSHEQDPDSAPEEALKNLTRTYEQIFLNDMAAIGNDVETINWVRATESIDKMQSLITKLYRDGFAYVADDGVYFSIEKYKASGKTYGQLLKLDTKNTSAARIDNDEYDKESVHDFALWKIRKDDEPAWEFELDGHNLIGRPGWHIECSAMSIDSLGQPFDIHTGGVDLVFPHHENEIAQSTAGKDDPVYAKYFVHNEHLLVNGKKMSKSLNNFYTLEDIKERGFDPLAFRLMVLQAHYRSQLNFTWENLEAAQNRLKNLYAWADLVHQSEQTESKVEFIQLHEALAEDLATPAALAILENIEKSAPTNEILNYADRLLGLKFSNRSDISDEQKQVMKERQKARDAKDFAKSDKLRDTLKDQGIAVRDTEHGQIWSRI